MSEYREESIRRKLVQRGIVEVRAVNNTKKRSAGQWLAVYFRRGCWGEWNSYKTEADARKQMDKMLRYWPMYVVERSVFDAHYAGQRFNEERK